MRTAALLLFIWPLLGTCGGTPVEPYAGVAPRTEQVYVIAGGWHTEIGLSVQAMTGPLLSLNESGADTKYVVFGWGERDYYMATQPGFGDLLRATAPGPSVVLVIPLAAGPADVFGVANVTAVPVSAEGLARLSDYLSSYLEKDSSGSPRRIADGPYRGSSFYASTGTYSVFYNCNAWTADALRVAGLPVSASGVMFASQVLEQVRRVEAVPKN